MRIVSFGSTLVVAMLLAGGVIAQGQQPKKVPHIGYVSNSDPATKSARAEAIRLALRARGYTEGQNIATEYRYAEGKRDRFPELAVEQPMKFEFNLKTAKQIGVTIAPELLA